MTPFVYINSICEGKSNLFEDPQAAKDYNAYIINKGLSYFVDTVLQSNEMNMRHYIPAKQQYDYLRFSIRPKKRFTKWFKNDTSKEIELLQTVYNCSISKANELLQLLSAEQLKTIEQSTFKGGKNA